MSLTVTLDILSTPFNLSAITFEMFTKITNCAKRQYARGDFVDNAKQ